MSVIRSVRRATAIMAIAMLIVVCLLILSVVSLPTVAVTWQSLAAAAWIVGTWAVTPSFDIREAVARGFVRGNRLRLATRVMAFAWLPVPALAAWPVLQPTIPTAFQHLILLAQMACIVLGVIGAIVLGILMERLAEWMRDDTAERLFNGAEWGIGCTISVMLLAIFFSTYFPGFALTPILLVLSMFAVLAMILSIGILLYATTSLARSASLSLVHAHQDQARAQRQLKRKLHAQRTMPTPVDAP